MITIILLTIYPLNNQIYFLRNQSALYHQRNLIRMEVSDFAKRNSKETDTIAICDTGLIPFTLINHHFIDLACLNSTLFLQCKKSLNYTDCLLNSVFSLKPKFIIIESHQYDSLKPNGYFLNHYLTSDSRFLNNYHLVKKYGEGNNRFMNYFIYQIKK